MINPKSIEELKLKTDIADVIAHYTPLKKTGRDTFSALCPFHADKNPSMSISSNKGLYHCFSCKAGGDMIKFVMDIENLTFAEAIEKIAQITNFKLEYTQNLGEKKPQKRILDIANAYYKSLIYQNKMALNYLYERGVNDALIEKFELGFAPESNHTLRLLQNEEIALSDALDVGIVKQNENGVYASFISRITFPIRNHTGNLVGFGGRTISNNPAKYINSPQSKIFDKSTLLYGYDKAKDSIFEKKHMIIVEGYMDVIMLHKAGFTDAVAVLGTALTQKHISLLKRSAPKITLCFDGDAAGLNAAFKSSALLAQNEIDADVAILSQTQDPADLVKEGKIAQLNEIFTSSTEIGEFHIRNIAKNFNLANPAQKQKAYEEISAFTATLPRVMAQSYEGLVCQILGITNLRLAFKNVNLGVTPKFSQTQKDFLELEILKSALLNEKLKFTLIELCDEENFTTHINEFRILLNGVQNSNDEAILREIMLSSEINTYNDENTMILAIKRLKIRLLERKRDFIAKSDQNNKIEKLERINAQILRLKEAK